MRGQRLHPIRRTPALLTVFLVAALAALPATAGGPPVVNEHTGPVTDTFPDELCGIDGTSSTRFVGNFKLYTDGTYLSTGNFRQTFTSAATGKSVEMTGVENVTGPFNPTDNGDGTITETFVFKGMPMKVSVDNGPTLIRDAGTATVAITFALSPDGSRGDFISQTVLLQHGPHPQLDDDAATCDAVLGALT
jgi:hypothetical protein